MRSDTQSPCDVGDALRACRTEAGRSRQDLAEEARVPEERLQEWEHGKGDAPTVPIVRALAHAMDMSTCELIQAAECD
jgi:transcriptional regulator with XRE-family HTH domain